MKTEIKDKTKKSWVLPGEPLSQEEFIEGIKQAEKGPFYTIEEAQKIMEEWKMKYLNSK